MQCTPGVAIAVQNQLMDRFAPLGIDALMGEVELALHQLAPEYRDRGNRQFGVAA